MSRHSLGKNNVKHKSVADLKAATLARFVKKVGGQEQADELSSQWDNHRRSENLSSRKKWEADGFLRGVVVAHNLSSREAMEFFKIGRYRFDRLRNLNPNLPVPKQRPSENAVSVEDKEFVRIFMKASETEPGYPCHHRSTPVYMADPNVTYLSLHNQYKEECKERNIRILSYESFRRVVKYLMPTLHLGKTKKDTCNSCFSLDLQIKDPETSEELKQELIEAKKCHLDDAIRTRKAISNLVKSVQKQVAPDDPPLCEDPVFIPACFRDPYDRLNRPLVEDYEDGRVGAEENIGVVWDNFESNEADDDVMEVEPVEREENNRRVLRVTVQDFGSGIPLPYYGATQPNHDYFASNITLHNMNFVDCATGRCRISYFDERQAGKDGNSVCSLRWHDLRQYIIENQSNIPLAECKVLDNCVIQNKSNTTHKFSMLCSLLIFPEGVTDIYFKVGHSHNQSDAKTGHAAKALSKKNIYTPDAIAKEVNKVKGLFAEVLYERSEVFQDWKSFLDKHFPNMDPGFTGFYIFQFINGIVHYKELNSTGEEVIVKSKVFCPNPEMVRKVILRELMNLSSTSNVLEICRAKLRLPFLPQKRISQKKIESMKTLYPQIPRFCRWFYPEGDGYVDVPPPIRARPYHGEDLAQPEQEQGMEEDREDHAVGQGHGAGHVTGAREDQEHPVQEREVLRKPGRPKKVLPARGDQPAIHRFFSVSNIDNPCEAGPSGVNKNNPKRVEARDFIEGDRFDNESEDSDDYDESSRFNKSLQLKFKPHQLDLDFVDSDDEFSVTLDQGGDVNEDYLGGKDDATKILESNDKNYGVDVNHNSGRIVMKFAKK